MAQSGRGARAVAASKVAIGGQNPDQDAFIKEVQNWSGGHFIARFIDAETLRSSTADGIDFAGPG